MTGNIYVLQEELNDRFEVVGDRIEEVQRTLADIKDEIQELRNSSHDNYMNIKWLFERVEKRI